MELYRTLLVDAHSIYLHSGTSSTSSCDSKGNASHRAGSLLTLALPLNKGPKEQVEDFLDVLCAQPAPVIHQHQTKHVQGQVSQSCLRVCQGRGGNMKKHHPKLILFSPTWRPSCTHRQPAAAQTAWDPALPTLTSSSSRQPQSPTKGCTKGSVPSQLNSRIIKSQSMHRDGHVPKTGDKAGADCSQGEMQC